MGTINIPADSESQRIEVGQQFENNATRVVFDCSAFASEYGSGNPKIIHKRPGESVGYPCANVVKSGTNVIWTLTAEDTLYAGKALSQLRWYVGDVLKESVAFTTFIAPGVASSDGPGTTKSALDIILEYVDNNCISLDELDTSVATYFDAHPIPAPIRSVNGMTGDVVISAETLSVYTKEQADELLSQKFDSEDIDSSLSGESTNPVQNKAIYSAISSVREDVDAIDVTSAQALSTANNAESYAASLDSQIKALENTINNIQIDVDDLGLYQDPDTYYVYPTYKGQTSENGIPLAGGSGGGGGGDVVASVITVENTSGWLSKTIPSGASCPVSFTWSSLEDNLPTGDGAIRISVNEIVRSTYQIPQGDVSLDLAPYLTTGANKVKIRISDTYDQGKTTTFNITCIALSISTSFDTTKVYSGAISFPYTPVGAVEKTVHFILDGRDIGTQVTAVSGRQMSYAIPAQSHGGHSLRVYFEAVINNETVRSNEIYLEYVCVDPMSNEVIITSSFSDTTQEQYASIAIPYQVYDPTSLTAEVKIYANGVLVSTQTVDRAEQSYVYRAVTPGNLAIRLESGNTTKTINITVNASDIDIEAETENLALFLSSLGRSNAESDPGTWEYEDISCAFTGFNYTSDGWQKDVDGIPCLRVSGDARVEIPYKPFANDFRGTGKTIEIEFSTRNVLDYDTPILSCMSGDRGISLTAQKAMLKSEQSEISTQYKEEEHIRVAFVCEKRSENRMLFTYIDGIPSGVVVYPTDDDFAQVTPVNISVGSNDCTIDLYCIRVYDNDLTRHQIIDNWIADTQDGSLMLTRYSHNQVYDAYGSIVVANLPSDLPYFILSAPQLPQYKGDKKTITGSYTDPLYPSKSFTFEGCQINVQGTSSAPYARKNYDMQFKEGFEMASGNHADSYALRPGAIPFNRFVLKADVASSEGANNVELVRLYNDSCPYKTPEMKADSRVRWGIDGFPIVVFWNDTATGTVSFLGKYNFNLPKRAPAPYGYADSDTMESWEFQNNTSDLMVFKTDYFDETMYTDPDTGDTKELWRYDYEARFPSDEWTDYSILQEFQSFVYSTYRANATGNALSQSMTYDGVTYTTDSADYRLAKFKAEFPTYAELDSFLFYYIFTELFLMVDSRAKNLFIGFNGGPVTASGRVATRKATAQPYDMDTAIGTNNEGSLVFGYGLEDADHLTGGANIFNGQDSVLWCNVRDAFPTEIRQMYQTLRSAGTISFNSVEERYEAHQSVWPEAIWAEDAWFKYIDPLINPDQGKEPTAVYLPMMQGSKEQQRKWWLYNRFKYMDSKWNAGEALSQVIQLRGYAKADITVTPYADIYPTVKYASYVVQERGQHGQPTTLVCPLSTVNDTEIYIYSAPQLASVGDLSGLKVGFADFSMATRLQSIKIGDSSPSYDDPNLTALTLGNNVLLQTLDVRNCSGLGTGDQKTVDISGCEIIEEVYFDGTSVQGVTLPNGGVLRVLSLPETITNLTVVNQRNITTFNVEGNDYSNISTLRVENSSSVIPVLDILSEMPANSRVRIIGFTLAVTSTDEVEEFYDYLDTMRGMDESGNNTDKAQVSGTITGLGTITGAWLAEMLERYPYIDIEYEHINSVLRFYNGSTLLQTQEITDAGDGTYTGSTPTKEQDAQYTYTFSGWSKGYDDNTIDRDALTHVDADRNVYACYSTVTRTYTVTWKNEDNTVLETDNNVPYGTTPTYDGATPTYDGETYRGWEPAVGPITGNTTYVAQYKPKYTVKFYNGSTLLQTVTVKEGNAATYTGETPTNTEGTDFLGWSDTNGSHTADAVLTNITANKDVYAAFEQAVVVEEITDDWDTIIANIDNGTYSTKYKLGNYKPLDLGTEGTINMQIVAMDADELASGGTAPLTFLGMELLLNTHGYNDADITSGGWADSTMRSYLKNTILPLIPSNVLSRINPVKKYSSIYENDSIIKDGSITHDKLWIPGFREIKSNNSYETKGVHYNIFKTANDLVKRINGTANNWWVRSVVNSSSCRYITSTGATFNAAAGTKYGIALGFCLGLEQETITDSWDTILANTNYATDYKIGDTKMIDLGTEGKHLMEIVGIDVDDRADGNGKAGLTWISKTLLNSIHVMNDAATIEGGWETSGMRSYLKNTIKPLIPETVRNGIVNVTKISSIYKDGVLVGNGQTTTDDIWIPSHHEVYSTIYTTTDVESEGAVYTKFNSSDSLRKAILGAIQYWWLRSVANNTNFYSVTKDGSRLNLIKANTKRGIALGFCTN